MEDWHRRGAQRMADIPIGGAMPGMVPGGVGDSVVDPMRAGSDGDVRDRARQHLARVAAEIAALEPLCGTPDFWVRVTDPEGLSNETLAHYAWKLERRAPADAERLEELVIRRTQGRVQRWARFINQVKMQGRMTAQECEELEEECLARMIDEWRAHKPGWVRFFATALTFCQQHTLEVWAVREGYWSRATERAYRVPRRLLVSLDALPPWAEERDGRHDVWPIVDPAAAELERASYLDLIALLDQLDPPARLAVVLDLQGVQRQEIGRILSISQPALRKHLRAAYASIGARYRARRERAQ